MKKSFLFASLCALITNFCLAAEFTTDHYDQYIAVRPSYVKMIHKLQSGESVKREDIADLFSNDKRLDRKKARTGHLTFKDPHTNFTFGGSGHDRGLVDKNERGIRLRELQCYIDVISKALGVYNVKLSKEEKVANMNTCIQKGLLQEMKKFHEEKYDAYLATNNTEKNRKNKTSNVKKRKTKNN